MNYYTEDGGMRIAVLHALKEACAYTPAERACNTGQVRALHWLTLPHGAPAIEVAATARMLL